MPAGPPARPGGGFVPPAGMPPAEASRAQINAILEGMTTHQLYDMLTQMKGLIDQNAEQARQILEANPQFSYALLQAELILGMVNPQVVKVRPPVLGAPCVQRANCSQRYAYAAIVGESSTSSSPACSACTAADDAIVATTRWPGAAARHGHPVWRLSQPTDSALRTADGWPWLHAAAHATATTRWHVRDGRTWCAALL